VQFKSKCTQLIVDQGSEKAGRYFQAWQLNEVAGQRDVRVCCACCGGDDGGPTVSGSNLHCVLLCVLLYAVFCRVLMYAVFRCTPLYAVFAGKFHRLRRIIITTTRENFAMAGSLYLPIPLASARGRRRDGGRVACFLTPQLLASCFSTVRGEGCPAAYGGPGAAQRTRPRLAPLAPRPLAPMHAYKARNFLHESDGNPETCSR
jgi:hypothetical protein